MEQFQFMVAGFLMAFLAYVGIRLQSLTRDIQKGKEETSKEIAAVNKKWVEWEEKMKAWEEKMKAWEERKKWDEIHPWQEESYSVQEYMQNTEEMREEMIKEPLPKEGA